MRARSWRASLDADGGAHAAPAGAHDLRAAGCRLRRRARGAAAPRDVATSASRRSSAVPPGRSPRSATTLDDAALRAGARARRAGAAVARQPATPRELAAALDGVAVRQPRSASTWRCSRRARSGRSPRRRRRLLDDAAQAQSCLLDPRPRLRAPRARARSGAARRPAHEHERAVGAWHAEWRRSGALVRRRRSRGRRGLGRRPRGRRRAHAAQSRGERRARRGGTRRVRAGADARARRGARRGSPGRPGAVVSRRAARGRAVGPVGGRARLAARPVRLPGSAEALVDRALAAYAEEGG